MAISPEARVGASLRSTSVDAVRREMGRPIEAKEGAGMDSLANGVDWWVGQFHRGDREERVGRGEVWHAGRDS